MWLAVRPCEIVFEIIFGGVGLPVVAEPGELAMGEGCGI